MTGTLRECRRRVGVFAATAVLTLASGGVAQADTGQDPGPNRHQPGRPGGVVDAAKIETMVRAEAKKLAEVAEAIPDDLAAASTSS